MWNCRIILKDKTLESKLWHNVVRHAGDADDRGPDSAYIAIYGGASKGAGAITIQSAHPQRDFARIAEALSGQDIWLPARSRARTAMPSSRPDWRLIEAARCLPSAPMCG